MPYADMAVVVVVLKEIMSKKSSEMMEIVHSAEAEQPTLQIIQKSTFWLLLGAK